MNTNWRIKGACKDADPNLFYPTGTGAGVYSAAKKLCAECPVKSDCLKYATDHNERYGMWGGLSPRERHNRPELVLKPRPERLPGCDGVVSLAQYSREVKATGSPCDACRVAYNSWRRYQYWMQEHGAAA